MTKCIAASFPAHFVAYCLLRVAGILACRAVKNKMVNPAPNSCIIDKILFCSRPSLVTRFDQWDYVAALAGRLHSVRHVSSVYRLRPTEIREIWSLVHLRSERQRLGLKTGFPVKQRRFWQPYVQSSQWTCLDTIASLPVTLKRMPVRHTMALGTPVLAAPPPPATKKWRSPTMRKVYSGKSVAAKVTPFAAIFVSDVNNQLELKLLLHDLFFWTCNLSK